MTRPALLTSRSTRSSASDARSANARTDSSDARSSFQIETLTSVASARIVAAAASPAVVFRTARMTWAPWRANSVAVTRPSPEFAPVMIAVRPVWSGMSDAVHELMDSTLGAVRRAPRALGILGLADPPSALRRVGQW